jgi:hypothetical protein
MAVTPKTSKTPMRCLRPVSPHSASQQCPGPQLQARYKHLAFNVSLKSRIGFVALMRTFLYPRLDPPGASTSPESGIAVSSVGNFLSREKRKMWLTFSHSVYL